MSLSLPSLVSARPSVPRHTAFLQSASPSPVPLLPHCLLFHISPSCTVSWTPFSEFISGHGRCHPCCDVLLVCCHCKIENMVLTACRHSSRAGMRRDGSISTQTVPVMAFSRARTARPAESAAGTQSFGRGLARCLPRMRLLSIHRLALKLLMRRRTREELRCGYLPFSPDRTSLAPQSKVLLHSEGVTGQRGGFKTRGIACGSPHGVLHDMGGSAGTRFTRGGPWGRREPDDCRRGC